jgi:Cellulase (glycosyl hydrolase family 5)
MRYGLSIFAVLSLASALNAQPRYVGYSSYQIITDFSFRPRPYFALMQANGVNFQRIWVLGFSGTAPKIREELPFVMENGKYNLRQIRPEYVRRMQNVLQAAQENHQQVMLTLFDHWSLAARNIFPQTPWYFKNNTEGLLKSPFPDFFNLRRPKIVEIQKSFVQQIVNATQKYQPIYEIMNEAAGTSCADLATWHERVAQWIHESDPDARIAVNFLVDCPQILNAQWVDIVSFHGNDWMKKGICPLARSGREKIVIIDTDGAWMTRGDNRLVRQWFREARSCGASFNHKDDIYEPDQEVLEIFREAWRLGG